MILAKKIEANVSDKETSLRREGGDYGNDGGARHTFKY